MPPSLNRFDTPMQIASNFDPSKLPIQKEVFLPQSQTQNVFQIIKDQDNSTPCHKVVETKNMLKKLSLGSSAHIKFNKMENSNNISGMFGKSEKLVQNNILEKCKKGEKKFRIRRTENTPVAIQITANEFLNTKQLLIKIKDNKVLGLQDRVFRKNLLEEVESESCLVRKNVNKKQNLF